MVCDEDDFAIHAGLDIFHLGAVPESRRPTPRGMRIGGDVLTLVRNSFVAEVRSGLEGLHTGLEQCPIVLYLTDDPIAAVRVTGVYIPSPRTVVLSMDQLPLFTA